MPELPDVNVYVEHLSRRLVGQALRGVRLKSPFLLRTFAPPLASAFGKHVVGVRRLGKRIVLGLEDDLFLVLHLMIAGRLHWKAPGAPMGGKLVLASFDFEPGTLQLTEASTKKRASLHLVKGVESLTQFERGGIEVETASLDEFRAALQREVHTVKRALTDPTLFSGIGNSYSDEILHAARLSPVKRTTQLADDEIARLYEATRRTLALWTDRLREQTKDTFPEKVTAFREEMAVHGRYGKPCPDCGTPVQRIVYAENETNYCPHCQTGGKLLADRALSRLLREDWPKSLDELEEIRTAAAQNAPPNPQAQTPSTPRTSTHRAGPTSTRRSLAAKKA
jgi:formamidopyrimidine-DNA glycosylase